MVKDERRYRLAFPDGSPPPMDVRIGTDGSVVAQIRGRLDVQQNVWWVLYAGPVLAHAFPEGLSQRVPLPEEVLVTGPVPGWLTPTEYRTGFR